MGKKTQNASIREAAWTPRKSKIRSKESFSSEMKIIFSWKMGKVLERLLYKCQQNMKAIAKILRDHIQKKSIANLMDCSDNLSEVIYKTLLLPYIINHCQIQPMSKLECSFKAEILLFPVNPATHPPMNVYLASHMHLIWYKATGKQ